MPLETLLWPVCNISIFFLCFLKWGLFEHWVVRNCVWVAHSSHIKHYAGVNGCML